MKSDVHMLYAHKYIGIICIVIHIIYIPPYGTNLQKKKRRWWRSSGLGRRFLSSDTASPTGRRIE